MKNKVDRLRVAIDGPAASGKNTLAKQIAKKYKLLHLDSGKLYRYFALQVYQSKDQKVNYTKLKQALKKLTLKKLKDKRLTSCTNPLHPVVLADVLPQPNTGSDLLFGS